VIIDTDMAADDWMAILYLLQRRDLEVAAITVTGAGEAHCEAGIRNALGLLALAGYRQIPVACGLETPLRGEHAFPDEWRESVDNLLGLSLPESQQAPSELTAVELLTTTIQSSPGKVTLLTLGPLTNVGEALHAYPYLVDKIQGIYIMGGTVSSPGNVGQSGVGIDNNTAEWNFYIDPLAANLVLGSGAPVTLIPLDATNHVPLTSGFYNRLAGERSTPEAAFVFDVMTALAEFIDTGRYYLWDPLAAAMLTDDSLGVFMDKNLCVAEEEGFTSGWSQVVGGCPTVRVALTADSYRFEQLFLDTLNDAEP
jgi:pyrimidine-specific ribonucleoside hydrolase